MRPPLPVPANRHHDRSWPSPGQDDANPTAQARLAESKRCPRHSGIFWQDREIPEFFGRSQTLDTQSNDKKALREYP
jgi:hypothetical protein